MKPISQDSLFRQINLLEQKIAALERRLVSGAGFFETGDIKWTTKSTAPPGFIVGAGQILFKSDYPELWAFAEQEIALGSLLWANIDATRFRAPDLQGRVLVIKGTHADVNVAGKSDGLDVGSRKVKHRHGLGTLKINIGTWGSNNIGSNGQIMRGYDSGFAIRNLNTSFTGEIGDIAGPLDAPAHIVVNGYIKT